MDEERDAEVRTAVDQYAEAGVSPASETAEMSELSDKDGPAPARGHAAALRTRAAALPRRTKLAACSCAAVLVVACGLGICFASAQGGSAQAADEQAGPALSLMQRAEQELADLSFAGQDVALKEGEKTEVRASGDRVMVVATCVDVSAPAEALELAAKRSAALADGLSGRSGASADGDGESSSGVDSEPDFSTELVDATYVVVDGSGNVQIAITNRPGSTSAQEASKGDSEAKLPDIVKGSDGWAVSGDVVGALPEDQKVEQAGGEVPTTPAGDEIEPGKPVPSGAGGQVSSSGGDSGHEESAPEGSGSEGKKQDSQQATSSSGDSSTSTPAAPSSGSSESSSKQAQKKWVQDSAAWDEPVYESKWVQDSAAWTEQVWIQDSAAWTEQVRSGECIQFTDGHVCYSASEAWEYQKATGLSYSVVATYENVYHEATGHYENVQTSTVHHEATGHWE